MNKKRIFKLLVLVLGIYFIVSLLQQILSLWRAEERIRIAQRKVEEAKEKNEELVERLKYVQSEEFIEKEVRDKLGMGKGGETVVIVPKDLIEKEIKKAQKEEPEKVPNWRLWKEAFWGSE